VPLQRPGTERASTVIRVLLADDQALVRGGFRALLDALRYGASGFLVKDTEPADLVTAVRVVARRDSLISPGMTRRLVAEFAARAREPRPAAELDVLTEREREVMALVAGGLSNDEIARELVVSPATARTHVSRAMTKLGARDRTQLVVLAYEHGLVRPGWS
jgi:DNA-binding NarL/FixJ family response regulator